MGALDGLRVLDLSRVLAGPWCTQLLADMGATIFKIERPEVGDDTRHWGPPYLQSTVDPAVHMATYFMSANRGKHSVALDIATQEGAEIVRELARHCDILVENFKVGGLAKYGLDYPRLSARNPALVYCSITGFGQSGPDAGRAGYDSMIQAMGGLMSITGQPDGAPGAEPMKVGVAVVDLFAGLYASSAILAALLHARATGQGQQIDIALFDVQAAMLANQAANFFATGVAPGRLGNAHPNLAPYQVFGTADGSMALAVGNDAQFHSLWRVLTDGSMDEDRRFATNALRVANRAALTACLAPLIAARPTAAWIAALEPAGVPCGPINDLAQVFDTPQAKARALVVEQHRSDLAQPIRTVASPMRLSATPPTYERAAPILGADTREVLQRLLRLSDGQIDDLRLRGAIWEP